MTADIESLTEISSDIKDIQDRIGLMLQEVQHLSGEKTDALTCVCGANRIHAWIGPKIHSNLKELLQGQTINNAASKKILSGTL